MRKLLTLFVLLFLASTLVSAAPEYCGVLSNIITNHLACTAQYGAGGAGTMTFGSFNFTSDGLGPGYESLQILASNIGVTVDGQEDGSVIITFAPPPSDPDGHWETISGGLMDSLRIDYHVVSTYRVLTAVAMLTDSFTAGSGQSGTATQTKNICPGGSCATHPFTSYANVNDTSGSAGSTPHTYVGNVNARLNNVDFWVRDRLNYQANNTSVTLYSFADEFDTAVPEPATFAMLGGGLLLLGFVTRKFRRA